MIKTGKVSCLNRNNGTVQVVFDDLDDMVSRDLPMLSFEYHMPEAGDQVLCLFLDNAPETGFCLGRFYSDLIPGIAQEVVRKRLDKDDAYVEYDLISGDIKIKNTKGKVVVEEATAVEIVASGAIDLKCATMNVAGNMAVAGNITATGSIVDAGGNSNHHGH